MASSGPRIPTEARNVAKIVSECANPKLRPVSTEEKNVLPSKGDVIQEKTEMFFQGAVVTEIEQGHAALKSVPSVEKSVLPSADDIKNEKRENEIRLSIEGFETTKLHHTSTTEKTVLPTPEDIENEKREVELRKGIESFEPKKLHKVQPAEKIHLPTAGEIAEEKRLSASVQ